MGSSRGWAALAAIGGGPGEWRRLAGAPREERDSGLRGPTRRVLRRGLGISPGTRPVRPEIDAPARRLRPLAWVASPSDPARFPSLDGASSRSLPVPRRASCQPRDDWTEALPRCRSQKPVSSAPGSGQGRVSSAAAKARLLCPGSGKGLSHLQRPWPKACRLGPGSGQGRVSSAPALAKTCLLCPGSCQGRVSSAPALARGVSTRPRLWLAKSMSPRCRLWPKACLPGPGSGQGSSPLARLWPGACLLGPGSGHPMLSFPQRERTDRRETTEKGGSNSTPPFTY